MTEQEHIGSVAMGDSSETGNPMAFFSENVDRWGAAEWFDRLAKAIREQDKAVRAMYQSTGDDKDAHEIMFETYRNIASSSAMQLVRDYEEQVRDALSRPVQEPVAVPDGWKLVPIKPTDDMLDSALGVHEARDGEDEEFFAEFRRTYRAMLSAAPHPAHGTSATAGQGVEAALQRALDFIESLTADPLLLADDIEMNLSDVQSHARIELASIRKALSTPTPKEESK